MQVVLTTEEQPWLNWADQFVAADPSDRARVTFSHSRSSRSEALSLTEQAAHQAGQSGRIIISVGHGAIATGGDAAWVDLAPNGAFRLEQALITNADQRESDATLISRVTDMAGTMAPADFCEQLLAPPGSPSRPTLPAGLEPTVARARCRGFTGATTRIAFRRDYLRIGELLRQHNVAQVLFLTCRIGTASTFTSRIAADWRVSIQAYRERILADENGEHNRARVYRNGFEPAQGTPASRRSETELPRGYVNVTP